MMTPLETTFLTLVEENRPRILRLCRVYARSAADREDLYQEILFQLWRALPGFKGQSHPGTWLYRIALNTAITYVRKATARGKGATVVPNQEVVQQAEDPRAAGRNPDVDALYDAIARLDPAEKAAMTLFLEEFSYDEIASVLGLTPSHVGVMLHRTKKKLFQLMKREEVKS